MEHTAGAQRPALPSLGRPRRQLSPLQEHTPWENQALPSQGGHTTGLARTGILLGCRPALPARPAESATASLGPHAHCSWQRSPSPLLTQRREAMA